MVKQKGAKNSGDDFKPVEDMPWRVAPKLKGVVKNKGIKPKKKPSKKY